MKQSNPFSKNQELTLEITGITSEGQGVGRCEGVAFFVPFALPGETVRAHIIKVEKKYCIAKIVDILNTSEHRIKPLCEAYEKCGGCALMHVDYAEQLKTKTQIVKDCLERLGGFAGVEVQNTIGMDDPWRYRNKGSFPIGFIDGVAAFGFYAERSHRLIPLFDCPIEDARITALARTVTEWANRNHVRTYDEQTGKGSLRACVVRVTSTGERMVVVVTKGELSAKESLIKMLDVESLYHNRNDANTNVIFGDRFTLLKGKSQVIEQQDDLIFAVSPQSFLQVNPIQTRALYETAIHLLDPKPTETIADVYCGIGTISLAIAKRAGKVIGIECVPEAIQDAKKNAEMNGIDNADFICGLAENVLPDLVKKGMRPDAIVIDPPRKGCEESVLNAIVESGVNRVVYVSCNPATLARDAKILSTYGFTIRHVQPVDMFPHTQHVETVALLCRNAQKMISDEKSKYKSWSNLKSQMNDLLCDSLKNKISYFYTSYHEVHNAYGRATINFEKKEMAAFSWVEMYEQEYEMSQLYQEGKKSSCAEMKKKKWMPEGKLCEIDFINSITIYLKTDVTSSLSSDNYLLRVFAYMDRRVGKRTLVRIKDDVENLPEWVKRFYRIRCEADGVIFPQKQTPDESVVLMTK